jgi:hypothetical protein
MPGGSGWYRWTALACGALGIRSVAGSRGMTEGKPGGESQSVQTGRPALLEASPRTRAGGPAGKTRGQPTTIEARSGASEGLRPATRPQFCLDNSSSSWWEWIKSGPDVPTTFCRGAPIQSGMHGGSNPVGTSRTDSTVRLENQK